MSNQYEAILWNKLKKQYDLVIAMGVISFLVIFIALHLWLHPSITQETLLIRAFGILAIIMLHIILATGPLARLNPIFKVLLYNRRHLGVSMFIIAAIHGGLSIAQFHGYGNLNPLLSIFVSNTQYDSLTQFPFQVLGVAALTILLLMAATSHDFWLKNLTPRFWKSLHMLVYLAYVLLIFHVLLGALQDETSSWISMMVIVGSAGLVGLHIVSAFKSKGDRLDNSEWIMVGKPADIPDDFAKTIFVGKSKIAVFKYEDKLSAVSNYCRHQGGPLGEGKIVDGCITCPWHGYQYYPHNGCSPPPFEEKVETYDLKMEDGVIYVNPSPHPEGTQLEPLKIVIE